jgi:hypothetical protein
MSARSSVGSGASGASRTRHWSSSTRSGLGFTRLLPSDPTRRQVALARKWPDAASLTRPMSRVLRVVAPLFLPAEPRSRLDALPSHQPGACEAPGMDPLADAFRGRPAAELSVSLTNLLRDTDSVAIGVLKQTAAARVSDPRWVASAARSRSDHPARGLEGRPLAKPEDRRPGSARGSR